MPRYAVSAISFFDNELVTDVVTADDYISAIRASEAAMKQLPEDELNPSPDEKQDDHIERLKQAAFNCDGAFNIVEIP